MKHLIDKDALVAEIERRIKEYQSTGDDYWFPVIENLKSILSFLDTLKVKEVDLQKEVASQYESNYEEYLTYEEFADIAKYFFELGLKTQKGEKV